MPYSLIRPRLNDNWCCIMICLILFQYLSESNKDRINSISAVAINDDGSCSMENCLENSAENMWCKLTAICKKLTGYEGFESV